MTYCYRIVNDTELTIEVVSRKDVGMYQCIIANGKDNAQASSQLQLGGEFV